MFIIITSLHFSEQYVQFLVLSQRGVVLIPLIHKIWLLVSFQCFHFLSQANLMALKSSSYFTTLYFCQPDWKRVSKQRFVSDCVVVLSIAVAHLIVNQLHEFGIQSRKQYPLDKLEYSYLPFVGKCMDSIRRGYMLITCGSLRVKRT